MSTPGVAVTTMATRPARYPAGRSSTRERLVRRRLRPGWAGGPWGIGPARATTRKERPMPDVFRLLEHDHRTVESMLDELADSSPGPEREQLVDKLATALQVHMSFEEEAVYPLLVPLDGAMEEEAEVEHRLAREGLTKMAELLDAPGFGAAVEMVKAGIGHHVREEEREAFPKLRSSVDDATSRQLTADLLQRKAEAGTLPDDLRQASKSDLLEMAADAGIERRTAMTKDELVAALAGG
jgi:hypothetical protein